MLDPGSEGRGGFVWFERTGTSHLHSGRRPVRVHKFSCNSKNTSSLRNQCLRKYKAGLQPAKVIQLVETLYQLFELQAGLLNTTTVLTVACAAFIFALLSIIRTFSVIHCQLVLVISLYLTILRLLLWSWSLHTVTRSLPSTMNLYSVCPRSINRSGSVAYY